VYLTGKGLGVDNQRKTKEQLTLELAELRQRVTELEAGDREHGRVEKALRQSNRELGLLYRLAQTFSSSLDLDRVLTTVLEEVRCLLQVIAASVWLVDLETGDLVCREAVGPKSEVVRGWRLAPGKGIASLAVLSGESMIVPDTREDERYFKGVDERTGIELRSIISVPLRIGQSTIGVLQVVGTEADLFYTADLELVESVAAIAAVAIENAELYSQLRDRVNQLEKAKREQAS
jgi:sigma-B regulation protein RsbU (phosphoserine phosphatase)